MACTEICLENVPCRSILINAKFMRWLWRRVQCRTIRVLSNARHLTLAYLNVIESNTKCSESSYRRLRSVDGEPCFNIAGDPSSADSLRHRLPGHLGPRSGAKRWDADRCRQTEYSWGADIPAGSKQTCASNARIWYKAALLPIFDLTSGLEPPTISLKTAQSSSAVFHSERSHDSNSSVRSMSSRSTRSAM